MSDALTYLLKARPEALGHYFAFLKEAGKHLDPKTRNLISVITKVHAQTERGLKQYLKRALSEGCTAAEVLDAMLMAFPALGLARIVWAVDVILGMDLPEFSLLAAAPLSHDKAVVAQPIWHDIAASALFKEGEVQRAECDGRGLFICRKGKTCFVFDSRCPHQNTNMSELALQGNTLTCPKHLWEFDATSGRCIKNGDSPLRRLPSKVIKGRVLACW